MCVTNVNALDVIGINTSFFYFSAYMNLFTSAKFMAMVHRVEERINHLYR